MLTRRRFLVTTAAGALVAAAGPALWVLASRSGARDGPPEIGYGSDRCDQCGMIISEARFAAAWRDGHVVQRYDDIGCLVRGSGAHLAAGQGRAYVHDAAHGGWIEATGAVFARSPQIPTPMRYGIAAFADREAAAAAHHGAPLVAWADLRDVMAREHP